MRRLHLLGISGLGWMGGVLFLIVLITAVIAPLLTPYEPQATVAIPFLEPSADHWLGTDDLGHDIFTQLVYGARLSLLIGLLSAVFALGVGLAVALLAGYFRGWVEAVLMRLVDVTLSFPFLPLVIVLAAFLGRDLLVTVVTITAVLWARPALVLRAQALKLRELAHVTAARAMGATPLYIIVRHMLPRLLPLATAQFVRAVNVAIFLEAAMSFLGVGDPNRISWGTMLFFANSSSAMLTDAWLWWILPVGLALTLTIVGLAFMGHAIEAWADPRLAAATRRLVTSTAARPRPTQPKSPAELLVVQALSIWYEAGSPVVDSISFSVEAGSIMGLVGESGCGKSTVAMGMMRLEQSQLQRLSGEIWLDGRELLSLSAAEMRAQRGREVALIPQNAMNALNPVYTVLDQLIEVTRRGRSKSEARARAHELLALVGIPEGQHASFPHELSGGMRQRVVIGMAIANRPKLLIADEPTTGLDVVTQAEVLRLLLELRARFGMGMLIISHDMPLIGQIADELVVMEAGRIVEQGTAADLLQNPQHPQTRLLKDALAAFQPVGKVSV